MKTEAASESSHFPKLLWWHRLQHPMQWPPFSPPRPTTTETKHHNMNTINISCLQIFHLQQANSGENTNLNCMQQENAAAVKANHVVTRTTGPCGRGHLALALVTIIKRDRYASECPLRKFATVFSQPKTHYGRQMWYQNDQKSVKFNVAV